jgi:Domain of unknown function (DUF4150)
MGCEVYANNNMIACKAADGKTVAAFPDVCFTPPLTPATPPGVPIPYPNTAMASDTTDGTKTVMISGQEVMLKNKSCFKTSTGDEAGSAPKHGVVTSKIKGKVNFCAWSMDVKFEGENVPRHLDLTGHNEASDPSNCPPWLYSDKAAMGGSDPCKEVRDEVDEKCPGKEFNKGSPDCSKDCCDAKKCAMSPYGRVPKCCDGKTKHHFVPDHCFKAPGAGDYYPGITGMSYGSGLAICVSGEDKDDRDTTTNQLLTHGKIHRDFDRIENWQRDNRNGQWSFRESNEVAGDVVSFHTRCKADCLKHQSEQYYGDKGVDPSTVLRADADAGTSPNPAGMGDVQAGWRNRFG